MRNAALGSPLISWDNTSNNLMGLLIAGAEMKFGERLVICSTAVGWAFPVSEPPWTELAGLEYSSFAQSLDVACPSKGMTWGKAASVAETHPEGADSWVTSPFLKQIISEASPCLTQSISRTSQTPPFHIYLGSSSYRILVGLSY